ncbi:Nitrogen permease regulator 3 [Cyphellophora attinorum]|uniref:Nitrogen permease regulator 3 n=1 Tax=Cyphellophora attinorum TaxID=1664694 RepID=A0A0N0NQT2_9EURO|nr:Nitrogen permease regulator 3 [Phialophora attinorum]KPI44278.1 Nitrogen permease regulator 3 [Phialophora attinorum]
MAAGPNPCLLGIILVAQTRAGTGAQILFHYPPDPLAQDEQHLQDADQVVADDSSSSDSGSESSSDDNIYEITTSKATDISHGEDNDETYDELSRVRSDEHWKPSWEPLLGIGEEGLVSLLAPGRAWHKRKFELGINDLVLVGRPVYVRESGRWKRRRRRHHNRLEEHTEIDEEDAGGTDQDPTSEAEDQPPPDEQEAEVDASSDKSALTIPRAHAAIKEMYDNVIKKLAKVLKWEQANNDYVWTQTDLVHSIKASHYAQRSSTNVLYNDLLKQSSLATAIATIYRTISTSRVAAVTFSPDVSLSLQIPPVTSTSYLPSLTDPPIPPGIWLTTANDPISGQSDLELDAAKPDNALQLAKSFTLLLRDNPHKILKDVQGTSGPLALPLANLITSLTPTKSFYKISQRTGLPLGDIQLLSRHLISWRRAMAIPPLHHQDTYIVSPNADLSQLATAIKSFESTFPMLPSLPRFLALLSGTPAPFGNLIPSSDHKEEYYRVLAWLLRGGWVTQLRTFAYVRVSAAVKKAVREQDKKEKHDAAQNNLERLNLQPQAKRHQRQHSQPKPSTSVPSTSVASSYSSSNYLRNRPHLSRPGSSSTNTTTTTATRVTQAGPQHNPAHASLVVSPLRASALETKWLNHIQASLVPHAAPVVDKSPSDPDAPTNSEPASADKDADRQHPFDPWQHLTLEQRQELHDAWPGLTKYFNGQEALERIAIREGWKRKKTVELLDWVSDAGAAATGVHDRGATSSQDAHMRQNADPARDAVVVTVRHW